MFARDSLNLLFKLRSDSNVKLFGLLHHVSLLAIIVIFVLHFGNANVIILV